MTERRWLPFLFFCFFVVCSLPASCFFYKSVDDAYVSRITRLTLLAPGLSEFSLVKRFAEQSGMQPGDVVDCFREEFWQELNPGEYNRLLSLLVERAVIWENKLELELRVGNIKTFMEAANEQS